MKSGKGEVGRWKSECGRGKVEGGIIEHSAEGMAHSRLNSEDRRQTAEAFDYEFRNVDSELAE